MLIHLSDMCNYAFIWHQHHMSSSHATIITCHNHHINVHLSDGHVLQVRLQTNTQCGNSVFGQPRHPGKLWSLHFLIHSSPSWNQGQNIASYIISAIQEGEHELLEEPVEERQEVSL